MRRKSITTYPRSAGNKRDGEARAVLQRQIYQVIVNLATNAATPSVTRFDQHKGGCAAWTSARTLERIFDPFLYDQADGKGNWPRPLGGAPNYHQPRRHREGVQRTWEGNCLSCLFPGDHERSGNA